LTCINDYAKDVLKQIRKVHPLGPFHLLGYSFGGNVAFEIARMLTDADESVGFLGMIDPWAKGYPRKLAFVPRMLLHLNYLMHGQPGTRLQYLRKRLKQLRGWILWDLHRLKRATRSFLKLPISAEHTMQYILEDAECALTAHDPLPLHRSVHLFRIDFPPTDWAGCSFDDPYNGWRRLVKGDLSVTRLPCGHHQIFDPPAITILAAALTMALNQTNTEISPNSTVERDLHTPAS
jgi:thioesterase domain-containing protein